MSKTLKYVLAGILAFAILIVVAAPASLVNMAIPANASMTLLAPAGTVWRGSGDLIVTGTPVGRVGWSVGILDLFRGRLGGDWQLVGAVHNLNGEAFQSFATSAVTLQGMVGEAPINEWLAPYLIRMSGDVQIRSLAVEGEFGSTINLSRSDGELHWQGGDVRYSLSGRSQTVRLPPLDAFLALNDTGFPEATVMETGSSTPLIIAQLLSDGFVKVGITKQFTKMIGNPWPGSDPDHAIVLEVEEQLL